MFHNSIFEIMKPYIFFQFYFTKPNDLSDQSHEYFKESQSRLHCLECLVRSQEFITDGVGRGSLGCVEWTVLTLWVLCRRTSLVDPLVQCGIEGLAQTLPMACVCALSDARPSWHPHVELPVLGVEFRHLSSEALPFMCLNVFGVVPPSPPKLVWHFSRRYRILIVLTKSSRMPRHGNYIDHRKTLKNQRSNTSFHTQVGGVYDGKTRAECRQKDTSKQRGNARWGHTKTQVR